MEYESRPGMRPWEPERQQPSAPGWSRPADQDTGAGTPPYYPYPPAGTPEAPATGFPPPYPGAPPPQWGAPAPPSGYGAAYPRAPYAQPGFPGQAGPPSQGWSPPGYPVQPGYGWPAAPSTPYGYMPGGVPPAPAPRKRLPTAAIIGLVALVLVVAIAAAVGMLVALSPGRGTVFSTVSSSQASATPTAQPSATANGYDFKDSLSGATSTGWPTDTRCIFQGGAYHVNPGTAYGSEYCASPAGTFSDFDVHVTVSQSGGPLDGGYGLGFRHASPGNFYAFVVASNGQAWFDKLVAGNWTHVAGFWQLTNFARGFNAHNTIRAVARGSSFTFYVNGTQVGQATDSTYAHGTVGVLSGYSNLDAAFTNFEVQGTP